MYKLIMHHTYKLFGEAIDISGNENHGFRTAVPYQADGRAAGSGALQFTSGPSRVRVTNKPVWQHLRAVKIETWVKLTALGQRRNLVEGELSFAFFIHPDGVLWGTFLGPATPGASPTWHGANSETHSPDGVKHTVPLNKWTKLTYLHDGIASLRLYIDDKLVAANYNLISAVPSVQSLGVHIGHWVGDDRYTFSGEIDEVKIWKYDPEVPYKQFFCRPMDGRQMECWRQVFDNMATLLRDEETSPLLIGLMRCLWSAEEELVRAIRSKGEAAIKHSGEFSKRYRELWCKGNIDSEEMKAFAREWLRWVNELLGESYMTDYRHRIESCIQEFGKLEFDRIAPHLADCDPAFAKYLDLLAEVFTGKPLKPQPKGLLERIVELLKPLLGWIFKLIGRRK